MLNFSQFDKFFSKKIAIYSECSYICIRFKENKNETVSKFLLVVAYLKIYISREEHRRIVADRPERGPAVSHDRPSLFCLNLKYQ